MDNSCQTLFYALENAQPELKSFAFIGARYHPFLEDLKAGSLFLQQYFRPFAAELEQRRLPVTPALKTSRKYSAVCVLIPKNMAEARCMLAQGIEILAEGGTIFCAADNKAGGTRLKKMLQEFGFEAQDLSRNHARAAWGVKNNANKEEIQKAIMAGGLQPVIATGMVSMPGIFGWDKIDKGSEILARHLPDYFAGSGADFGCGYGYLSRQVLQRGRAVEKIYCIDADWRAVQCCQVNLDILADAFPAQAGILRQKKDPRFRGEDNFVEYLWEDLTKPLPVKNLDWIVMNPPFHEGKSADAGIGQGFIATAAAALKKGGQLWMVANAQLPYENVLRDHFSGVHKKFEGEGFKVFEAVR
ncbi:MAG: class I SAM-dependent methyltransferase [Alphaproteobacteria bacterium]|nr:class I SAM-dependent methyltransferase [Alphaproteobacteria bacterium]